MSAGPAEILSVAFWTAASVVVYAYVVYPALVWCLCRVFGRVPQPPTVRSDQLPSLTLLIAAHNEEAVIGARLRNALAMDYPPDRLRIVVASDGSSDGTAAIVSSFAERGVRLLAYNERRGKAAVVNAAVAEIDTDLIMLSDANTDLEPDAARKLARWFADPAVGVACGRLVLTDPASGKNADGLYWRYETFLKQCEARLGALLGSNGAIYAIRRALYVPIPPNTIVDDFVIPLQAKLRSRCRIVYDCDAVATEETAADVRSEFRRRARIGAGGFQAIAMLWRCMIPRTGWLAFAFVSHKLLRWLCPFALAAMLVCAGALSSRPFFAYALAVQVAFYTVSMAAMLIPGGMNALRPLRLTTMFTSMNAALAVGFWRWARGVHTGAWDRTDRLAGAPARAQAAVVGWSVHMLSRRDVLSAAGLAAAAVVVMFDAWRDIARLGLMKEELGYVFLAPVMIGWIAASRRSRLVDCPVRREWAGLLILAVGWLVFWYGYYTDPVLWRAGAVMIAIGAAASALGLDVLLRLWPAVVACVFLVPISPHGRYQLALPLQNATAALTQSACDVLGIYVSRSGNLLSINGVGVTVAEACNGMRMVLTLLMVCYLIAFISPLPGWVRALMLIASPGFAIAANVIRLVPTVWMFGHASPEAAETFHSLSGWIMTVLAFLALLGLVRVAQWAVSIDVEDARAAQRRMFERALSAAKPLVDPA